MFFLKYTIGDGTVSIDIILLNSPLKQQAKIYAKGFGLLNSNSVQRSKYLKIFQKYCI